MVSRGYYEYSERGGSIRFNYHEDRGDFRGVIWFIPEVDWERLAPWAVGRRAQIVQRFADWYGRLGYRFYEWDDDEIRFSRDDPDVLFLNDLGPERPATRCKLPNCDRGTVAFSTLCRTHQFEVVKRRLPIDPDALAGG